MSLLLLLSYVSFYARYTYWAGDFAWGDRYVSTSVELAALLAVPLLLRYRANLSAWTWRGGMALIAASLIIQLASLAFWLPLEIYQMETLGHPTFVIALRLKNICSGQNASVGIEQRIHEAGCVGLRSHHDLEFSSVRVAKSGSGAEVGGGCCVRSMGSSDWRTGHGFVAPEDDRQVPASQAARSVVRLAIFAIQQIAHGLLSCRVHFAGILALVGIHAALGYRGSLFGSAALRTAVGEPGLVRLELEFFRAVAADFDGESHMPSTVRC
jgi:hypothetical protein